MKIKTAILASHSGSIAESLYLEAQVLPALEKPILITNNPKANFIERMKKHQESVHVFQKSKEQEKEIINFLKEEKIEMIFLAGYMQVLSIDFTSTYHHKIINIHPSLLPKFRGMHGYRDSFHSNESHGGITIHYVDEGIDTGEIISQVCFSKRDSETLSEFTNRGKELERIFYPQIFKQLTLSTRSLHE